MFRVCVSLLLVVVTSRVELTVGYQMWCSPKLWEGRSWTLQITHTDQGLDVWENSAMFSVDVIGQRYARHETGERNGQHYSISYLYYYPASTLYKIQDGTCVTSPISGNLSQHCTEMPDDHALEYLKEYMGDYKEGVWCNGVRLEKQHMEYFYSYDMNLPLNEEMHGEKAGVPTYSVTNYHNISLGIIDPSVFTPPASCLQS